MSAQPMKIQLNTAALEAMFPEGSEARVDLQQAVIANIANRIHDSKMEGVIRGMMPSYTPNEAMRQEMKRMANEHLVKHWNLPPDTLADESTIRSAINKAVKGRMEIVVHGMIADSIKNAEGELAKMHERRIKSFTDGIETAIQNIEHRIRQRVVASMDEIIRIELANALGKIKAGESAIS